MAKRFELKKYETVYSVTLEVATYLEGNLAIQMVSWTDIQNPGIH